MSPGTRSTPGTAAALTRKQGPSGATIITAIRGIGGIGKSRLAAEYCRERTSPKNPVAIGAWVDAQSIMSDLQHLAERLGISIEPPAPSSAELPSGGPTPEELLVANLANTLQYTRRSWLIVVDNALAPNDPAPLEKLLTIRARGNGRLIVPPVVV